MCRKNDLVHSHSHYPPALFTGLFSWRARTIFTSHSGELPSTRWKRRVLVALMNRFDRIIALTTHERDMYLAAGVDPTRIVVISDAINVEFFSQPGDAFRFRQRWKLPAEVPVLLFVANIRKFKNPEVVLRAFRRVREREPRAVLAIAGKDLLPRQGFIPVTTLAEQAGVTEGLVLTGWLPAEDLRDAYAAADVVVNSSATTQESFSISTWEAIAAGRAVCLPHLGTFLATVGDAALYHEPSDDAGLAENILRYLREPDLRAKHVAVTRQLARQFAAPQVLRQLHSLYDSLLEG
jgi:D-inositol-3-phosphate glycosyltransferase